jgi:hypothetical protein
MRLYQAWMKQVGFPFLSGVWKTSFKSASTMLELSKTTALCLMATYPTRAQNDEYLLGVVTQATRLWEALLRSLNPTLETAKKTADWLAECQRLLEAKAPVASFVDSKTSVFTLVQESLACHNPASLSSVSRLLTELQGTMSVQSLQFLTQFAKREVDNYSTIHKQIQEIFTAAQSNLVQLVEGSHHAYRSPAVLSHLLTVRYPLLRQSYAPYLVSEKDTSLSAYLVDIYQGMLTCAAKELEDWDRYEEFAEGTNLHAFSRYDQAVERRDSNEYPPYWERDSIRAFVRQVLDTFLPLLSAESTLVEEVFALLQQRLIEADHFPVLFAHLSAPLHLPSVADAPHQYEGALLSLLSSEPCTTNETNWSLVFNSLTSVVGTDGKSQPRGLFERSACVSYLTLPNSFEYKTLDADDVSNCSSKQFYPHASPAHKFAVFQALMPTIIEFEDWPFFVSSLKTIFTVDLLGPSSSQRTMTQEFRTFLSETLDQKGGLLDPQRAGGKIPQTITDDLQRFRDVTVKKVRASLQKRCSSNSVSKRSEAINDLIDATALSFPTSKYIVELGKTMSFLAKKIKNEQGANRLETLEYLSNYLPFPSEFAHAQRDGLAWFTHQLDRTRDSKASTDFKETARVPRTDAEAQAETEVLVLWLQMLDDALQSPDFSEFSTQFTSLFQDISRIFLYRGAYALNQSESVMDESKDDEKSVFRPQSLFDCGFELQWRISVHQLGVRGAAEKWRILTQPIPTSIETSVETALFGAWGDSEPGSDSDVGAFDPTPMRAGRVPKKIDAALEKFFFHADCNTRTAQVGPEPRLSPSQRLALARAWLDGYRARVESQNADFLRDDAQYWNPLVCIVGPAAVLEQPECKSFLSNVADSLRATEGSDSSSSDDDDDEIETKRDNMLTFICRMIEGSFWRDNNDLKIAVVSALTKSDNVEIVFASVLIEFQNQQLFRKYNDFLVNGEVPEVQVAEKILSDPVIQELVLPVLTRLLPAERPEPDPEDDYMRCPALVKALLETPTFVHANLRELKHASCDNNAHITPLNVVQLKLLELVTARLAIFPTVETDSNISKLLDLHYAAHDLLIKIIGLNFHTKGGPACTCRWWRVPELANFAQALCMQLSNTVDCTVTTDGYPVISEDNNKTLVIFKKMVALERAKDVAWVEVKVVEDFALAFMRTSLAKSILSSWWGASNNPPDFRRQPFNRNWARWRTIKDFPASYRGADKFQRKSRCVSQLLDISPSAIHLKMVRRHLIQSEQHKLDPFLGSEKTFRGVFFTPEKKEEPAPLSGRFVGRGRGRGPGRGRGRGRGRGGYDGGRGRVKGKPVKTEAEVIAAAERKQEDIFQNELQRFREDTVDTKDEDDQAGDDFKKTMAHVATLFDHKDVFCVSECYYIDRLQPRQVNVLGLQLLRRGLSDNFPMKDRLKDLIRWTLLPTTTYSDVIKLLDSRPNLPVALIEVLLRGCMQNDETLAPVHYLLSPEILNTDRARVAAYVIGRVTSDLNSEQMTGIIRTVLSAKKLKITAQKEMIRLLAADPTTDNLSILASLWARNQVHREARIEILKIIFSLWDVSPEAEQMAFEVLSTAMSTKHIFSQSEIMSIFVVVRPNFAREEFGLANKGDRIFRVQLGQIVSSRQVVDHLYEFTNYMVPSRLAERYAREVILPLCRHTEPAKKKKKKGKKNKRRQRRSTTVTMTGMIWVLTCLLQMIRSLKIKPKIAKKNQFN